MNNLNAIGLDEKKAKALANSMNELLANFQMYYQNLRGLHWNIKGPHFFALHEKFEELYDEAAEQVDEIAERILTLGEQPDHTFKKYIERSEIEQAEDILNDQKAVETIVGNLKVLLMKERAILEESDELNDEGTNALVSDLISGQEKTVWMLSSWLKKA